MLHDSTITGIKLQIRDGTDMSAYFPSFSTTQQLCDQARPHLLTSALITSATIFFWRYYLLWLTFLKHPGNRVPRSNKQSPSYKAPPAVSTAGNRKQQVLNAVDSCQSLITYFADIVKPHSETKNPFDPRTRGVSSNTTTTRRQQDNDAGRAHVLNMDHIYVPFPLFVLGDFVAGISSTAWAAFGLLFLRLRVALSHHGFIKPMSGFDASEQVAGFCLESSIAIHFVSKNEKTGNAIFCIPNFPVIEANGDFIVYNILAVEINVNTKRMISANLDDKQLTASQTFTCLWYYTFACIHPQEHSMANWGCNIDYMQFWKNPRVAFYSLISIIYNHYGYHNFCFSAVPFSINIGLAHENWTPQAFKDSLQHGENTPIPGHVNVVDLFPDSRLVRFLTLLRPMFFKEYMAHRECFPNMHPEAFFICTVVHSVDHAKTGILVADALWLDVDDNRFARMAEMGRVSRAAFTTSVPIHPFHNKFKGINHPFYKNVYNKARKIDVQLADMMETCMCE